VHVQGARWLALALILGLLFVRGSPQDLGADSVPVDGLRASHGDRHARQAAEYSPGDVIVRWRDGISHALLSELHASIVDELGDPAVVLLRVPEGTELATVAYLASRKEVVWAQPNYLRHAGATPNDPIFGQQWGMQRIQAPQAWDVTTGSPGVIVAIVDTGVDLNHPDLQGKLVEGRNFLDPDQPPQDDGGHGTHVAGTIAGTMNNATGVAGVASGASIMPVKVLRANGSGKDSTVAAGMRWAIDRGARIINMSFSGAEVSPILTEAVAYAQSRNVVLVVAAGNESSASPTYPAATDPVIAVAATDQQDRRANYSNYGDWIDIAAPGTGIWSTYWSGASSYRADTGTSMAAPHVTGVIALLLSLRPELTPTDVEAILRSSADPLPDAGLGAGRLNAARAVQTANTGRRIASPTPVAAAPAIIPLTSPTTAVEARAQAFAYNAPVPSTTLFLPSLARSADAWTSRVAIMNTAGTPTSLAIRLVDPSGASPASLSSPLPPFGSTTLDLATLQFLPPSWDGSAVLTADAPIAAVVTMTRPGANAVAYDARASGSAVVYAPLVFKNRNGWNTTLFAQNLVSEPTTVQLVYSSPGVPGSWTESITIPPFAARHISQADTAALPNDFSGSVTATSLQGSPVSVVVLETHALGNAAAYTAPLTASTSLVAPIVFKNRATNGVWNTGIQVQNLGADAAQLLITYRPSQGQSPPVSERATMPPGMSRTFYQPSSDVLPNGFVGSAVLVVENGQPLAGLVNEVNYDRNISSTYQLLSGGQSSLYMPLLLRDAERMTSGIQVQNSGPSPATVTITYRSASGVRLAVQTDTIEPGAARGYIQTGVQGLPEGFTGTAVITSEGGQPLAAIVNAVAY
jgi:thermitase